MPMFSPDRRAFVVCGCAIVMQRPEDTAMTCLDWMREVLNLTDKDFKECVRGYMLPGRIQFFTGEDYRPSLNVTADALEEAMRIYEEEFGETAEPPLIGNGCHVGTYKEQWPPILYLDTATAMHWEIV